MDLIIETILFLWNIISGAQQRGATRRSSRAPSGQVHSWGENFTAEKKKFFCIPTTVGLSDFFWYRGVIWYSNKNPWVYLNFLAFFFNTGGLSKFSLKIWVYQRLSETNPRYWEENPINPRYWGCKLQILQILHPSGVDLPWWRAAALARCASLPRAQFYYTRVRPQCDYSILGRNPRRLK